MFRVEACYTYSESWELIGAYDSYGEAYNVLRQLSRYNGSQHRIVDPKGVAHVVR